MNATPETDAAEMSDTPETDAVWKNDDIVARVMLSRKLERERDEARAKIKRQADRIRHLEGATNNACGTLLSIARRERDEARAERDAMRLETQREAEHHDRMVGELERLYDQRDELQKKYDTLAAENMLEVHKLCKERDEALENCAILQGWAGRGIIFAAQNGKISDIEFIVKGAK